MSLATQIDWDKVNGLIPAIIQDQTSGDVLMLGYMDLAALRLTVDSGLVHFWSRTKQRIWLKGETSGNRLQVKYMNLDCDHDSLVIGVKPEGPVCHLGTKSCFINPDTPSSAAVNDWSILDRLEQLIEKRKNEPVSESYTRSLFAAGKARMGQKVGEEGVEVALAGALGDPEALASESADLIYHLLVLLSANSVTLSQVLEVLRKRTK